MGKGKRLALGSEPGSHKLLVLASAGIGVREGLMLCHSLAEKQRASVRCMCIRKRLSSLCGKPLHRMNPLI